MASVWEFATKRRNPHTKELEGQCNRCNSIIKCSGNSTTTLKRHLQQHGIKFDQAGEPSTSKDGIQTEKRQKTVADFFERESLKEIVSDMATDGVTIRAITRNKFIRKSITRDGHKLPANETDVMKLLHDDFEEKQKKMVDEIQAKVAKGIKFSMTVDEATTLRGRRYFGINIHERDSNKTYKTGLVRILGSCNALSMIEILRDHLKSFGISMEKDLVGSTQDGAAVNKRFISLIDAICQFCLNHGLHLGVCDTLYKKKSEIEEPIIIDEDPNEEDNFDEPTDFELINENHNEIDYHEILKKSRKIVKFFKHSPVRNHVLQTKIKQIHSREIEMHLDVKTRWNSIPTMLEPLIKTEASIRETLQDFKALDLIENFDFGALKSLLAAMEPVKLAVENLSREDSTLMSADTILNFMFTKLSNIKNEIAEKLLENLKQRVGERLNPDLMNLLRSLKDPSIVPSRNTINFAGSLAKRLFEVADEDTGDQLPHEEISENLSMQEELNALLQKSETTVTPANDAFKWLKSEFTLFKNTGQRTENLQKLFNAILTIKPTSTDVERVFSVTSSFCTKIRSRLSDKSLQALVFLKYYYNKSNK